MSSQIFRDTLQSDEARNLKGCKVSLRVSLTCPSSDEIWLSPVRESEVGERRPLDEMDVDGVVELTVLGSINLSRIKIRCQAQTIIWERDHCH